MSLFTIFGSPVRIIARDENFDESGLVRIEYVEPEMNLCPRWVRTSTLGADDGIKELDEEAMAAEAILCPEHLR